MSFVVIGLFISLLLPAALFASVPKLMTYQGILKDSAGNFLTGSYAMKFRIYDADTAGLELWNETQSSVTVTSGKFSVKLGSVTPVDLPFMQDYWLSIQVGTDAEMSPRVKLTSVGYAYMAERVVNSFTRADHDALSHMNISGVKAAHTLIAKTNFKLDAYTKASANSMGDLFVDTFNDASGIDSSNSSNYRWRPSPDYDVTVKPNVDSYTVLLIHMNGSDGSTGFTDASDGNHPVTANGNAQLNTSQFKFGGASGLFDGNGDYLSIPSHADFQFGTGDYTIDFWVRFNSISGQPTLVSIGNGLTNNTDASKGLTLTFYNGGQQLYLYHTGVALTFSWGPLTGTWYHVAVTRASGSVRAFVNGSQIGSTLSNSGSVSPSIDTWIGQINNSIYNFPLDGRLDELRFSKGIARWAANFTPPTAEYGERKGTATVVSASYSESPAPVEALLVADESLNAGTITYYVSRDDGLTWTQISKETLTDISSQPNGTKLRWKAVITDDAELKSIGVAV